MLLGIEIGGTKLQLGVGDGRGELAAIARHDIDIARGAAGILEQIERAAAGLMQQHAVERVGIGFGGPCDAAAGVCTKSHQVAGWDGFPLVRWCRDTLGKSAVIGNDCDVAALAEAKFGGAGRPACSTSPSAPASAADLCSGAKLHGAGRPAAAEIGHLRPGLLADQPEMTVESLASGPAIAAAAVARMTGQVSRPLEAIRGELDHPNHLQLAERMTFIDDAERESIGDLLNRCGGDADRLTAKMVAAAAGDGNEIARQVLEHACLALGWGLAQVITLVAPEVIVIGGGVSLVGEQFFFAPVREAVRKYVFPPLANSYKIVPAALGELVVVHGAIALAAAS